MTGQAASEWTYPGCWAESDSPSVGIPVGTEQSSTSTNDSIGSFGDGRSRPRSPSEVSPQASGLQEMLDALGRELEAAIHRCDLIGVRETVAARAATWIALADLAQIAHPAYALACHAAAYWEWETVEDLSDKVGKSEDRSSATGWSSEQSSFAQEPEQSHLVRILLAASGKSF